MPMCFTFGLSLHVFWPRGGQFGGFIYNTTGGAIYITMIQPWQLPHAAAVDDRAMEPDCRPDLKSNGTSETSAPQLLRRDRSPNGRLSGPDRAPAGASAGFTDKKWRTAAAPYDGADGAPATRRPRPTPAPQCRLSYHPRRFSNGG